MEGPGEIVVDDRERPSGVVECLLRQRVVAPVVRRMELGDYLVANRVLVERKTVADFAASIVDGRLFRQAGRLASCAYRPVMIIEGGGFPAATSGVSREAIQGSMVSLVLLLGVPCLRTEDVEETARLLGYIARQIARRIRGAVYRHGYRPTGRRKRQLHILQGLPGIGPARAGRLLDTFGSVERVFIANGQQLAGVEGIGEKLAEGIRDVVGPGGEGGQGEGIREASLCRAPPLVWPWAQ